MALPEAKTCGESSCLYIGIINKYWKLWFPKKKTKIIKQSWGKLNLINKNLNKINDVSWVTSFLK